LHILWTIFGRIFKGFSTSLQSLLRCHPALFGQVERYRSSQWRMEDPMLKYLSICAGFLVLAASPLNAQETQFVSHRVEVPGANFSLVFVLAKSQAVAPITQPEHQPSILVVHPTGDALAYATESEVAKAFNDVGLSQVPIHAFRVEGKDGNLAKAVNVYVIPNGKQIASAVR
jgi:hypothetical protein